MRTIRPRSATTQRLLPVMAGERMHVPCMCRARSRRKCMVTSLKQNHVSGDGSVFYGICTVVQGERWLSLLLLCFSETLLEEGILSYRTDCELGVLAMALVSCDRHKGSTTARNGIRLWKAESARYGAIVRRPPRLRYILKTKCRLYRNVHRVAL